jgi:Nif-specific regulatory protein
MVLALDGLMSINLASLKLKVLSAICQTIDRAFDLEGALLDVLRILSETLSMQRATVTLLDRKTDRLVISASCGLTQDEMKRGVYGVEEGVTGRIFQTGLAYYAPDIRKDPLLLDRTGARRFEQGTLSFIGVPIVLHGRTIGVLNADRLFDDEVPPDEDVEFLSVVATLVARMISINEQVEAKVRKLEEENVSLKYRVAKEEKGPYIVGRSHAMAEVERQMARVAPTRATILLLGESGTGKTLIARIIRDLSDRMEFPFVKVNCAAIPENLLEAELFGHEKGAYTGAAGARTGRFEEAHKGTIFLDEIGELPLGLQAKLLRVIQEREFERLGSNRTIKVDVRIVAATNRDLAELVEQGAFREDLYYRLSVFPIRVPPLRERKEDIPVLVHHFLERVSEEYGRPLALSPEAHDLLRVYDWPGNVREMENLIERLVIMADEERLGPDFIRPYLLAAAESGAHAVPANGGSGAVGAVHAAGAGNGATAATLGEIERNEVVQALARHGWVQHKAAAALGITPRQIGYKIRKHGLSEMVARERVRAREA